MIVIRVSPNALPSLLVFVITAAQLTHTCPTIQNEENNHPTHQETEETAGKPLEKSGAIVDMFHEDSCSFICHKNKMYGYVASGAPAMLQQPPEPSP